jgi:sulfatase maturation enzyme AslB (radical SAM superfamily)
MKGEKTRIISYKTGNKEQNRNELKTNGYLLDDSRLESYQLKQIILLLS